jgi:hypothetical protein
MFLGGTMQGDFFQGGRGLASLALLCDTRRPKKFGRLLISIHDNHRGGKFHEEERVGDQCMFMMIIFVVTETRGRKSSLRWRVK